MYVALLFFFCCCLCVCVSKWLLMSEKMCFFFFFFVLLFSISSLVIPGIENILHFFVFLKGWRFCAFWWIFEISLFFFFRPSFKQRNTHTHTLFFVIHFTSSFFFFFLYTHPTRNYINLFVFLSIRLRVFYHKFFFFLSFDPSCPYTYICSSLPVAVCCILTTHALVYFSPQVSFLGFHPPSQVPNIHDVSPAFLYSRNKRIYSLETWTILF